MTRRLAGFIVVLAILAAGSASHHHAALSLDPEGRSEEVVTTHDPSSNASHWHAILDIVALESCWACPCSRLFDLPRPGGLSHAGLDSRRWNALPPRAASSVARFTRRSRAPPILL